MSIAQFVSPADDAAGRGATFGETWRPQIHATLTDYDRLFHSFGLDPLLVRGVGERTLDLVADWAPWLAEEIAGVAKGAALELWQVAALNARSEVLAHARPAGPGECSTSVYLPPAGPPQTIQTWDWYEHMADAPVVWQYQPAPEKTVTTLTEYGILAKIGVTSRGLGLHFNLLLHDLDGAPDGIPVHLVARRVLDEAETLDEAEALARSARVSASVALTMVTYDGVRSDARVLELSPAGVARIDPDQDRFVRHTNHFLDPELATGERLVPIDDDTVSRHAELRRRAPALQDPDLAARTAALTFHRAEGAALCCHPEPTDPFTDRWQTLVVIALDLAAGRLRYQRGTPCAATPDGWTAA